MRKGMLNNVQIRTLNHKGWNTNLVSSKLQKKSKENFDLVKTKCEVQHPKEDLTDTSNEIILNSSLQTGSHTYKAKWVVSDSGYDVLSGLPCHDKECPSIII